MNRPSYRQDTETFKYWNVNPKKYITGDCAIRAIALASGEEYNDVIMGIALKRCELSKGSNEGEQAYMESLGFVKHKQPRKSNNKKYTIEEFCKKIAEPNKKYLVSCAGHLTCVVDKRIYDIWNCGHKAVGNYWERNV